MAYIASRLALTVLLGHLSTLSLLLALDVFMFGLPCIRLGAGSNFCSLCALTTSVVLPFHEFRLLSENIQLNLVFEDLEQRAECDPKYMRDVVYSLYRSRGVRPTYGSASSALWNIWFEWATHGMNAVCKHEGRPVNMRPAAS